MFPLLTGNPENTGIWTGPLPTTNGATGSVNLAGIAPGTYVFTYTVSGQGTCQDSTATVTFVIDEILTSGTVAVTNPAIFCESQTPAAFDLFSLLDGEDAGGVWTAGTTSTGTVITSPVNLTGLAPGIYNFTYTQNGGASLCLEESTTVQIEILTDPNAGAAVATSFCENDLVANSPIIYLIL